MHNNFVSKVECNGEIASSHREKNLCHKAVANISNESTVGLLTGDDVIARIPRTEKQKRHDMRIKARERRLRKFKREKIEEKLKGNNNVKIELKNINLRGNVNNTVNDVTKEEIYDDKKNGMKRVENVSQEKELESKNIRALIKVSMGSMERKSYDESKRDYNNVSPLHRSILQNKDINKAGPLPIMDKRKYHCKIDSYDSGDYIKTLALGTMMLRKSKANMLVDASYNRFSFNDPVDLPDWFLDDERKNYKPQLPIHPKLIEKIKERFLAKSTRPITKVAEARARKAKRAQTRFSVAKKSALNIANNTELSEVAKIKAISKAMRASEQSKNTLTYVVTKNKNIRKGEKGTRLVDKRMKCDKRSLLYKKKKGRRGGLTGSKRRRHHR